MGIGVTVPTNPLSFANTIGKKVSLYPGTTGDAGLGVYNNEMRMYSDHSNADITFGYDNLVNGFTENVRMKGNGYVGIGIDPSNPLSFGTTVGKKISLYPTANGDYGVGVYGYELRNYSAESGSDITFGYDDKTNGFKENVRLMGNGNVGIGTNNPISKLEIKTGDGETGWTQSNPLGSISCTAASLFSPATITTSGTALRISQGSNNGILLLPNDKIVMGPILAGANGYLLSVGGKIIAEEVKVQLRGNWPDYVFKKSYKLPSIAEFENYIDQNKHLPGIPAAKEVETNGLEVGEMQKKMMEKLEQYALYIIDLQKQINELKTKLNEKK